MSKKLETKTLEYGDLPLHIRFLFLFIGIAGISAIIQGFVIIGVGFNIGVHIGGTIAVAIVVTIGSMRNLKRKSVSSYRRALIMLGGMPIYYGYIAYTHPELASMSKGLIYWWPLVNSIMYVICIIFIANKITYGFYNIQS